MVSFLELAFSNGNRNITSIKEVNEHLSVAMKKYGTSVEDALYSMAKMTKLLNEEEEIEEEFCNGS